MTHPTAGQTSEQSRIALVNIAMGMVVLALMVLLASCGDRPTDPEEKSDTTSREDTVVVTGSRSPQAEAGRPSIAQDAMPRAMAPPPQGIVAPAPQNRDQFEDVDPNPVKVTAEEPVSTFSIDVDTASYSFVRRTLNDGVLPPRDAVRIEEMINYFPYDYPLPDTAERPFEPSVAVVPTPWNADTRLMRIAIQGYDIEPEETPDLNLVLLLDVSGSMNQPDKLPLLKKAMALLVDSLDADDRVAIVVYAGAAGTVLEPTPGNDEAAILGALERLEAGGSTAGGEGIRLAYALAERNFDPDKVNRVVIGTDGDFNVGITDPEQLEDFVARKRETGIYLNILGFGRGNYNDALMQKLVQAGNGQAAYIDTLREARKVLVDDLRSTLFPIAKDVKIQVEFNPKAVAEYRLIGYETRMLAREDFNNDEVDAGEIGSGHSVTAIYEMVPVGSPARLTDPLRYGDDEPAPDTAEADPSQTEFALLRIRYKLPEEDESRLIEQPVMIASALERFPDASVDTRFAASVAAFGQYLKGVPHLKGMDLAEILDIAVGAKGTDEYGYRAEFTQLIRLAQSAQATEPLSVPPAP